MPSPSDDDMDDILRSLPPVPESWIARAEELPQLQRALAILGREASARGRMEEALREAGLEPDESRVHALERLRVKQG